MPGTDWQSTFPPAKWLAEYRASWLPQDAVAGITLAAYAVPVSLAYSSLAGLPPHYGIYCYLAGGLVYALLGTSRQLAMGPTSAISMLVGTSVAAMSPGGGEQGAQIAALAAFLVAAISVVAWVFRLSTLVNFISETVLAGFKAGAALTIALTQLPKLFGVKGGGEHFIERLWILGSQLGDTNLVVLGLGLIAMAALLVGEWQLPGRPVALVVVAVSIVFASILPIGEYGVATVGQIPRGLPEVHVPSLRPRKSTAWFLWLRLVSSWLTSRGSRQHGPWQRRTTIKSRRGRNCSLLEWRTLRFRSSAAFPSREVFLNRW